jgi:hypothetical protein
MGDDKLIFGHHRSLSNGINGWAELFFDRQAGLPKLRMMDLSNLYGAAGALILKDDMLRPVCGRLSWPGGPA